MSADKTRGDLPRLETGDNIAHPIRWCELEQSKTLLRELREPEPQLPPLDLSKVRPIPCKAEIRAAVACLNAEKAAQSSRNDGT